MPLWGPLGYTPRKGRNMVRSEVSYGPFYIIYRPQGGERECIDEFPTIAEAEEMLAEYQMAYERGCRLWITRKEPKGWNE